MKVMCLTEEEISDVFQVIAGVLQLGNVHFMAAGGAQVAEKSGMSLGLFSWFSSPHINCDTPWNVWWGCAAQLSKLWPFFNVTYPFSNQVLKSLNPFL